MSPNEQETCALCKRVCALRNSHIVPEFLHSPLYDGKHRFHTYGLHGTPVTGMQQSGQRERLLCDNCEQRFSVNERWASDFYRGSISAFGQPTLPVLRL